jgi:hypothetical protein
VRTLPLAAHPDSQIYILGTELTGATSVTFNGVAATFLSYRLQKSWLQYLPEQPPGRFRSSDAVVRSQVMFHSACTEAEGGFCA